MRSSLFRALAAVLGLLLAGVAAAQAAEPADVIFFTGNTYGTLAPCPS